MSNGIHVDWLKIVENLTNAQQPDLTVTCGGKEHRVHKFIMTSVSRFFEKACNGPFKEAQTNVIDLPEDNPEVVEAMVEYLYHGNYFEITSNLEISWSGWTCPNGEAMSEGCTDDCDQQELHEILFHLAVYELADKYEISGLKLEAEEEIDLAIVNYIQSPRIDDESLGSIIDQIRQRARR